MDQEQQNKIQKRKQEEKQRVQEEEEQRKRDKDLKQTHTKIKKSLKKRNQPSFWKTYEDPIGYVILGLVVAFILYANFTKDNKNLSNIFVNDDVLFTYVNEETSNLTLKNNPFFDVDTLKDASKLFNIQLTSKQNQPICDVVDLKDVEVPESYNFYESFPQCKFTSEVRKCANYAEGAMSLYRNRFCRENLGEDFVPSVDYVFECDRKINRGCKNGYVLDHFEFVQNQGGYIDEKCFEQHKKDKCPSEKELETCVRHPIKKFCVINDQENIQKEIASHGPVLGFMLPYRESLVYDSGVFNPLGRESIKGFSMVKIVGWGSEKNEDDKQEDFWLVDPMWGNELGNNGVMKVLRKKDDQFLDHWAVTVYPLKNE